MASKRESVQPRTFFLNETHELSALDKEGGGRQAVYLGVSWTQKAKKISHSLESTVQEISKSHDPMRDERYFVVAMPTKMLRKKSEDKKRAPDGHFDEKPNFGGAHGKVFDRLGLDLLFVTDEGKAVVHGNRERVEQLFERSKTLSSLGTREQSRWVAIDAFETIPLELRVDSDWLNGIRPVDFADVIFELQPVLGRVEADTVLRAIGSQLQKSGERLTGIGTDFSGRYWFRGRATQRSIRSIAKDFFSVQSIHSPLHSYVVASSRIAQRRGAGTRLPIEIITDPKTLPCVAVVDVGIPSDHSILAASRRGQFVAQDAVLQTANDHGSFVASRVVFGDAESAEALSEAAPRCSFYDAVVAGPTSGKIDDKVVMTAVQGVRGAAPDVRVFNLSFGDFTPLVAYPEVEQREKRLAMQDLDNFIHASDVIVVVAAGNSQSGVLPTTAYPSHFDDSQWKLGAWACGFNSLVCGSFVSKLSAGGLVQNIGWPSAFSRIGPGLSSAPVPTFGAEGGNCNSAYNAPTGAGLGVWGYSGSGHAEDRSGSSYAAPILASECALTLSLLQGYCAPGTHPFAVTVKALLALLASRTTSDAAAMKLSERTLGLGKASFERLVAPSRGSAVIVWQGSVESPKDVARVQIPIPADWLGSAEEPIMRMYVCSDPPVNEAAKGSWACRKVKAVLHPGPEADALRGSSASHNSFPLYLREFKLKKHGPGGDDPADGDLWILELSYDEIFDYPPGMVFDPRQRVAIAAELVDRGDSPVDPQPALQALPSALSMVRLSVNRAPVANPVVVRTRT